MIDPVPGPGPRHRAQRGARRGWSRLGGGHRRTSPAARGRGPQQRHLSQGCQRVCLALTARHHDCAFRASAHRDRAPAWPAHPSCRLSGGTPGAGQGLGTWSPQPSCTAGLERPAHATPSCLNTDCQALPLGRWRPPHRALHLPGAWAMLSPQRASCPRTPHPTPGDGSLGWPPAEDADMPSMWGARDTE